LGKLKTIAKEAVGRGEA